jgi:hypothetical protein
MAAVDTLPTIPLNIPDPPDSPVPMKVLAKWDLFIGEIAAGTPIEKAMMKYFIKRAEIEACVRSSSEQRQRWNEARLAARKREFSAFDVEEFFEQVSGGLPIVKAFEAVWGGQSSVVFKNLMHLCAQDPDFKEMYQSALQTRALHESEAIRDIADGDGRGDYLDNGKGGFTPDGAKVNRDKLRVDTRYRLMSAWNAKMFGEKKGDVQVNVQVNHAARLEEARSRRTARSATKIPQRLIEATFKDVPPVEEAATDWDDVPREAAQSTVWREES